MNKNVEELRLILKNYNPKEPAYRGCIDIEVLEGVLQEIERLKEVIEGMIDNEEKYNLEINRLHSIIKEVREYIEKQVHRNQQFYEMDIDNILEILDKENI